jgi:DNA-binding transcriptional LysR family regulator
MGMVNCPDAIASLKGNGVAQLPPETLRQTGTLSWYGAVYALDDFLVYAYYGHEREHSAQIAAFRDHLRERSKKATL